MKKIIRALSLLLALLLACGMFGCGSKAETPPDSSAYNVDYSNIATGVVNARAAVHDPSIVESEGKYYIFGSHMTAAVTDDLRSWTMLANSYSPKNPVYQGLYDEDSQAFRYAGSGSSVIPTDDRGDHVWAPDVIYNEALGKWFMYYCTSSTWNASNLCYATADSVEGPYEWQGALIYSGFTSDNIDETDVLSYVSREYAEEHYIRNGREYNYNECPNAIDPSVFYDADGRMWMVYGSWSGGIFLLELDEQTGLVIHPEADPENRVDPYFGKKLIGGGHKSIEGPYIQYDAEAGCYYLFVSYGGLTREGGYQIRVFRSDKVDGDYVDMNGNFPNNNGNHAYYGLKLSGNYMLPSLKKAYMATGHNSSFIDTDGKRYICYHTRFNDGSENHAPRVKQYFLNEEGWPCMLPYATDGETISPTGYPVEEVVGSYYVVDQGMAIDAAVAQPFILILTEKGNVFGDGITGTWTAVKDSYYVHINYNDTDYSGVFCKAADEAGTEVMTFSAVGKNTSIWGVKYGG